MKKTKLFLALTLIASLCVNNVYAHESELEPIDNMSEKEEKLFNKENVVTTMAHEVIVDGEKKEFILQEFSENTPVPTLNGEYTYVARKGLEILEKNVFDERQSKLNSRITTTDRYADGRGTYLYVEIVYTKTPTNNSTYSNYNMSSIYCNSSGSTLTKYSVTYGQSGFSSSFAPVTQSKTVNVDPVIKTFSTKLSWKPVINYNATVGVTQTYTTRGWTHKWAFNLLP
ncbi:MAG: hypothetical protein HFE82_00145 [Erysipelotrichaceae bacterium]|nr:hypothetical protein [Erysipelotrichaceae bacterium]